MRVKLAASLLLVSSVLAWATGSQGKKSPPCEPDLASCSNEGCGEKFDSKLNERKNITSDSETPTLRTLTWMKKLDDPEDFSQGESGTSLPRWARGR